MDASFSLWYQQPMQEKKKKNTKSQYSNCPLNNHFSWRQSSLLWIRFFKWLFLHQRRLQLLDKVHVLLVNQYFHEFSNRNNILYFSWQHFIFSLFLWLSLKNNSQARVRFCLVVVRSSPTLSHGVDFCE